MPQLTLQQALDLAMEHHRHGRLAQAEGLYRQILAASPDHPGATHLLGVLMGALGRMDLAEELIRKAIALVPHEPIYYLNLARLFAQAGRLGEAPALYHKALALNPHEPVAHYDLGAALQMLNRLDESAAAYREAIRLRPDYAQAHNNLGGVLKIQGRFDEALACYRRALALNPHLLEAHANLGALHHALGRYEDAIACYDAALRLNPAHAQVHFNRGISLAEPGRYEESIAAYRRAIELKPDHADACTNLGNSLRMIGRLDEAIAAYREALRIKPDSSDACNNLGVILDLKGELAEALAFYRRAVELNPGDAAAHSNLVYSLHFHPQWLDNPRALLEEHRAWSRRHADPLGPPIERHSNDRDPERRLRIGYVSPDFRNHAVGRFMLPLLCAHDKRAFDVYCYTDVTATDQTTERLRSAAGHWRSMIGLSDHALADLVRQDQIDILIDLTMHMRGGRLLTFARRPAPVQATYLAYCATTGLSAIDYRITDCYLDPPDGDLSIYAEESIRIESYWCYAEVPEAPAVDALPALRAPGRPGNPITFGCLNNFCKVSPQALETWGRLLLAFPHSRLLLHANPGSHREKTRDFLKSMGVDPGRCDFVGAGTLAEYFAYYHDIDIALDPFPYAGGTTTCDALWMGVPLITLRGKAAVGRGGVSILSNAGLPEWIADDPGQYIELAMDLAGDLPHLEHLRSTLRDKMRNSILMNGPRFARNIESAYRHMWQAWCAGDLKNSRS